MKKQKGKFIVIEGGDGSGKDTHIDLLKGVLPQDQFVYVKDPGTTEIGLKLREIILHDDRVAPAAELLMYLAARVQMVEELIRPHLEEGLHVITNRFDLSTICYQIYGRGREQALDLLQNMSAYALGGVQPDLLIFLDCPPDIGLMRVKTRGKLDRLERETLAFHTRVYEGYKKHIHDYNHVVVDTTTSVEDSHKEVLKAIRAFIA